jgi:hypothetical protein
LVLVRRSSAWHISGWINDFLHARRLPHLKLPHAQQASACQRGCHPAKMQMQPILRSSLLHFIATKVSIDTFVQWIVGHSSGLIATV